VLLILILLYAMLNGITYITLWIVAGEILPKESKRILSGILLFVVYILTKVLVLLYQNVKGMGIANMFFLFTIGSILQCWVVYRKLPETRNRSCREIQNELDDMQRLIPSFRR
jgi:MFS transporter, SP family, major inositol transporter